ncbi:hypothetical protein PFICI_03085 [Pestalotiopsis fici W106-1]|uniref:Ecp2 effector protein-like domain-containing protein n=1 Tax=Pestalotiopsis fici (strain W106-1 / CGMCC3.15140) TaxID=1229662 RepID=W3XG99_PESFW|nr:uncharacterized protein PFICI_03085 [Pestalotiopsis fici W106-1]ETS85060.1 hypothetical protein PFICI_03085 [Pestalotiopsis fici W106-1]
MQFSKMLLGLSVIAQAAAAPSAANSSALDTRTFQSTFTARWYVRTLCDSVGSEPLGNDYANPSDCKDLADYWRARPGFWHILSWDGMTASVLTNSGNCFVRISNLNNQNRVHIGSQDIVDFLDTAVENAQKDGISILGGINCMEAHIGVSIMN